MTPPPDAAIDALWKHLLEHWDEESAHGAFIEYCQQTNALVAAAARYREVSADGEHHEAAQKRLSAITILALSQLESTRTQPKQAQNQAIRLILFIVLLAALGAALVHLGSLLE